MGRNRVLSFMSHFSTGTKDPSPSPSPPNKLSASFKKKQHRLSEPPPNSQQNNIDSIHRPVTPPSRPDYGSSLNNSPSSSSPQQRQRSSSRPLSMVQTYQPPYMDINEDTIPELQPIFTLLNSHSNKLYQEGYFLKLDDQNTQGKPNADRTWSECFAQLVGTVLSLWDAAELDAAGEDGEVLPKFINLTDASIKMIESLPTRSNDEQPLQNILSISTAGRNRYLLHFNSHHSLIQWTAGIRLAMYEHSTLQEAYTGALIAGRGKTLNNINVIMERSRVKSEQWVRVRFGAGVPWRRCWCVVSPPDEKEYQKQQKDLKKRSAYDRSHVPVLKGDIKFYDTRKDGKKQKKAQPIATITDAYAAYAIYPQAKSLIDASTLLKIEGNVVVHTDPPSATEGFIFIMPEVSPAVSGFEMLLRFLFPTWDTFGLYGRPGRLVASILDPRSLMFAMPKHKRYGYLETLDISNLILEEGSSTWAEREWRKRLKEATGTRMNALEDGSRSHSRSASRSSARLSFGSNGKSKVGFADDLSSQQQQQPHHVRNISDPNLNASLQHDFGGHGGSPNRHQLPFRGGPPGQTTPGDSRSSDEGLDASPPPNMQNLEALRSLQTPEPVSRPPAFSHGSETRTSNKAYQSPELRRANSRLSNSTLAQMATAAGMGNISGPHGGSPQRRDGEDVLSPGNQGGFGKPLPPSLDLSNQQSISPNPYGATGSSQSGTSEGRRSPYPPGHGGPSRSPMPQQQVFRPDQTRPPPNPYGRGQPPPGQRPPPSNGPPNHRDAYRPGPPGAPPPGPGGRGGFQRKPVPRQTNSITPDHIIDHYASNPVPGHNARPGAAPHMQGPGGGGNEDRRRPGVLKTVGGAEPPLPQGSQFNIPEVNFGPTINYGASSAPRSHAPRPAEPFMPNQVPGYLSSEQRPYVGGPNARQEPMDPAQRTMAWQPGGSQAPGPGPRALTPEQYVQQRAGGNPATYGGNLAAGGRMGPRTPSPQQYPGAGRGGPPQGQYGNQMPSPAQHPYQG